MSPGTALLRTPRRELGRSTRLGERRSGLPRRVHLRGLRADPGAALSWYRRARDLGASEAEVLLRTLETK